MRSQLSSDCLHLNHQLTDFKQDCQGVQLFFDHNEEVIVFFDATAIKYFYNHLALYIDTIYF